MDPWRLSAALLRALPPEAAHGLALRGLEAGLGPRAGPLDPALACRVAGLDFASPVGLAAGFDKDGRVPDAVLAAGFGFAEIGSVTPLPQPGNPRPRLFRLAADRAVINRMGFNSEGHEAVAARLARCDRQRGPVGVNLGKNRDSADPAGDYAEGARRFATLADYLVVNVSSPNTPGLRALQGRHELTVLLDRVRAALPAGAPPLFLKIAPDLTEDDRRDIARVALDMALDGLVVSNTTIARPPGLRGPHAGEAGGLSGAPLAPLALELTGAMYRLTEGRIPLIGAGGIASAEDAWQRIRAGASLVQLYTAMIWQGPRLASRIARGLAARLRADGYSSVSRLVGVAWR